MRRKTKKCKKGLLHHSGILIILALLLTIYKVYIAMTTPDEYLITNNNYFEYQKHYECSGYASAYALRSLGVKADGVELYGQFINKNADGTLAPGFLWKNLKKLGYKSNLLTGSVTDLKYAVSKGIPVIVLIKVKTSQPYLHYVSVVGYDEDVIYVADSLSYMVNEKEQEYYNRTITIDEFKQLWKNDSFCVNNIYITLRKR